MVRMMVGEMVRMPWEREFAINRIALGAAFAEYRLVLLFRQQGSIWLEFATKPL